MKIVQVMPEFALAGAEIMCENLTYELVKEGHDVVVVSMYTMHTPITDRLEKAGIKVRYLEKKSGIDFSMLRKLRKLYKEEKPDVVHTHRYSILYAMPVAIMCGIKKKIHTVHNIANKENGNFARKINKVLFKFFSVIPIALSEMIQRTIVHEYRMHVENVPIIFNGMPIEKFKKKSNYDLNDGINIIHVGRFQEQKNHVGLIRAFKIVHSKIPEVRLHLYGEGHLMSNIRSLVINEKLNDSVFFCGLSENIPEKLIENDIFCLPSNYEGVPITLIEAMAVAMPIVATRVGGVSDMITSNVEGLLCENAPECIARSLIELINNKDLRISIGKKASEAANNFSSAEMAKKYIDVYYS